MCRFLFNENRTTEQVVNVQQRDDSPNKYIPLTYDSRSPEQRTEQSNERVLMEARIVPAMTDDSPSMEEDLDISKEDIR